AIREMRGDLRDQAAELVTERQVEPRSEHVQPVDRSIEPAGIGLVEEAKQVRTVRARTGVRKNARELVPLGQTLSESRLQAVLMRVADDWDLSVIATAVREVRQRIKPEQGPRLGADPVRWNRIARERRTAVRIDGPVPRLGQVSVPFRQGGHQAGLCGDVAVAHPLIIEGQVWSI